MKKLVLALVVIWSVGCSTKSPDAQFNLGFETAKPTSNLPENWLKWGTYHIEKDSITVHSGKYSSMIVSDDAGKTFGSVAYRIPAKYEGKTIELQGYMKIENVENGFAGLLLRVDGNGGPIVFDNMQQQQINGTKDWEKYSIKLNYPANAENIYVAGILSGKGKAWFDDFTLTIDGKDVQTLTPKEKELNGVQSDKEFDNGSQFRQTELSPQEAENLYKLAKVWGFMKYYHPAIARGEVNWDYELFRILPEIGASDFNAQLLKWIKARGKVESGEAPAQTEQNVKFAPSTQWISDKNFAGEKVSNELTKIENANRDKTNYYVSFFPNVGNPNFQNENAYPHMKWNDTGYRLLSLFRYWNIIEYFFPYKNLLEKNWDDVLKEYIPKMVAGADEQSYKLTLLRLIGEVHDTHANIWQMDNVIDDFFGTNIVPIEVKFIDNKAVVVQTFDQLNKNSHIKPGDVITQINGVSTDEIVAEKVNYCPASNYPTQLRDLAKKLLRTNENNLTLTLENQSGTSKEVVNTVSFTKINFRKTGVPSHSEIGNDIGYIYPASLKKGEIDSIAIKFAGKKGMIVDLRCYPSDFIVFSLSKYLMPAPTEFVTFTNTTLTKPGVFYFRGAPLKVGENNNDYYKGKVIILVNEQTLSQAEYTSMALRVAPNATVIGSTTAGADGNVSAIMIPGKIRTMISGIGVYYPDGTETQRVGIVPDLVVKPTIAGIRAGKDEVLEKAIELIRQS